MKLDYDVSVFAVATLRSWRDAVGRSRYPAADRLLICADGGGSNGSRVRAWKPNSAFAADAGLHVTGDVGLVTRGGPALTGSVTMGG
ncbi:MAG: transposase [Frankiales bacterium]|nr:transposase [Frankiales bacterium]